MARNQKKQRTKTTLASKRASATAEGNRQGQIAKKSGQGRGHEDDEGSVDKKQQFSARGGRGRQAQNQKDHEHDEEDMEGTRSRGGRSRDRSQADDETRIGQGRSRDRMSRDDEDFDTEDYGYRSSSRDAGDKGARTRRDED